MTHGTLTLRSDASRRELALKLSAAFVFAAATALAAQIRVPLPFTPVPITAQTSVVLLSGALLGGAWGAAAMGLYLVAGILGAPVYAGASGGLATLGGATGGYLAAFLIVPLVVARLLPPDARPARAFVVLLAASAIVLLWGMVQLALVLDLPLRRAFLLGVAPFLVGDVVKVALATLAFSLSRPLALRLRR